MSVRKSERQARLASAPPRRNSCARQKIAQRMRLAVRPSATVTSTPWTGDEQSGWRSERAVLAAVALLALAAGRERTGIVGDAIAHDWRGPNRRTSRSICPKPITDVRVREARLPGRPIVLIDPGHGGRDPGAPGVSGTSQEKQLTLAMAKELADLLGAARPGPRRPDSRG